MGNRRLAALAVAFLATLASTTPAYAGATSIALASTASTNAATANTPAAAESRVVAGINAARADAGLVPLRVDSRLVRIARARSADMARFDYFDHRQSDGRTFFDLLAAAKVRWYAAGEAIALNGWPAFADSANAALRGWLGSAGHRAILLSRQYNYLGLAVVEAADGDKFWTAVAMKGPDRTAPAVAAGAFGATKVTATSAAVRLTWSGADRRLQTLTAGLRDFQVQKRVNGGTWTWVSRATTVRGRTFSVAAGATLQVRVRARDRKLNASPWVTRTFTAPKPAPAVAPAAAGGPNPAPPAFTDGTRACGSLQAAIDATPAGGTLDRTGCAPARGTVTIRRALTLTGGTVEGRILVRAAGVTLRGLEVRAAAVPLQEGAIDVSGVGRFTLANAFVHDSGGACVSISGGSDHVVRDTEMARCGQEGFHLTGVASTTLRGNWIHHNNTARVDPLWEAGGGKATRATGLVFDSNQVWANRGPGLWCDILCRGTIYRSNRVWDNTHAGIMDEVSTGAVIESNLLARNGAGDGRSVWWGANILVSSSSGVTIRSNVVAGSRAGIAIIGQVRSDWGLAGPYAGITLASNTVIASERLVGYVSWGGDVRATGAGGRYWYPKGEPSYCRFEREGCVDRLAAFEPGRYLTAAERDAVLATLP